MKTARLKVNYKNKDISEDISKYLISFNYNDNLTDNADDISIVLDNGSGVWINEWYPVKGSTLDISLLLDYDNAPTEIRFGRFNIDELEVSFSPDIFRISAITALLNTKFKDELVTQPYKNISIKQLVSGIAKKHGFKVEYKTPINYKIASLDQKNISDANFLYKILSKYGLIFKINDGRIVIYDGVASEKAIEILSYSNLSFKEKTYGIYSSVKFSYKHPKKAKKIEYTYTDKKIKTGKTLVINTPAETIAEAELIAKARLKKENDQATSGSLSMLGSGDIFSGQKISLKDIGVYSGEYKVERVTHNLSRGGYTNNLEFISL